MTRTLPKPLLSSLSFGTRFWISVLFAGAIISRYGALFNVVLNI